MKKDEVIKILKQYNEWRTDKNVPPSSKMIEPSVITEAINSAIGMLLSDYIDKESLTINRIIDAVNSAYKGDIMATVSGERPSREEHEYRQIAYYFLSLIRVSQRDMAKLFNRTAGSVSLALKSFEDEMVYPDVRAKYDRVLSNLSE